MVTERFSKSRRSPVGPVHIAVILIIIFILLLPVPLIAGWRNRLGAERKTLLGQWEAGQYQETYDASMEGLEKKPMDFFLLTLHGFSAYQLGIAQINNSDIVTYIDECIWSLRKAILVKVPEGKEASAQDIRELGRIYYVLGKAYYYKGAGFADLAVEYLVKAGETGFTAPDISEYLGMSYAAIQDYRSSVAAFSQALAGGTPSDALLLAIARSYIAMNENDSAKAYLLRCVDSSKDARSVLSARLLLGKIYKDAGDSVAAEDQYLAILKESGENAEAHYRLGEIYAEKGDATKARAEWRRAVRVDPAHTEARARLNM